MPAPPAGAGKRGEEAVKDRARMEKLRSAPLDKGIDIGAIVAPVQLKDH